MNTRKTGTVKFFDDAKGFGFIKYDKSDEEIFVHITGIKGSARLKQDDKVEFETEKGKKGLIAVDVTKI